MARDFKWYAAKRVVYLLITAYLILTFNFLLFRVMPGDATNVVIPKGATPELRENLTAYYGLDKSLPEQYIIYLEQLVTGDLGESYAVRRGSEVSDILMIYTTNTIVLVGGGIIISILVGVYVGRESAWNRGKFVDRFNGSLFLTFYCMPTFLFALVMLIFVANYVPTWPSHGTKSVDYYDLDVLGKLMDRMKHLILPMGALVLETIGVFFIITRSSLVDVLTEDYLVTAFAKGMAGRQVLKRHAMPNAMLPVVTVIALETGWVLSGSIMVEIVFSFQGLGWLTWEAVWARDYPILQAAFMLEALAVLAANFIADMLLFKLDPRVRI